jgi:glutamate synthase (NADPH/NADH) small chain
VAHDPSGFLKYPRQDTPKRPAAERVKDWRPIYLRTRDDVVAEQAARCMDCGVAFCHSGCPLGNLIPEWNEFVARDDYSGASERLHATNNFPEFTGWICPAPCEAACVLALNTDPVTI